MAAEGLEALIVASRGVIGLYGPLQYISGYHQRTRLAYAVILREGEPILIMPARSDAYWAQVASGYDDVRYVPQNTGFENVTYEECAGSEMAGILRGAGITGGAVGIAGMHHVMAVQDYLTLVRELPQVEFRDATDLFDAVKRVKDVEEIKALEEAAHLAALGFQTFLREAAVGKTEWEVTAAVEQAVRARGAIETLIIITTGPLSRWPSNRKFAPGDVYSCFVEVTDANGYWAEFGSMVSFGTPPVEAVELFQFGKETLDEVGRLLRPGARASDLAAFIENRAQAAGYRMGVWHGHGVGIDHDGPAITREDPTVLEPGMTLAMHPNFVAPDGHRAHMVDMFVITEEGSRRLLRIKPEFHILCQE